MGLVLGMLAAGALLTAAAWAINGARTVPPPRTVADVLATDPEGDDPLAPRLFDRSAPVRIHVAGAVQKPGVYALPAWSRVIDAVKRAGGATAEADLDAINLADRIRDGEQLRIPVKGRPESLSAHVPTPEPPPVPPGAGGQGSGRYPFAAEQAGAGASRGAVNLNTATREELDALPEIGPTMAEEILAYRRENGPFLQPEDLMNVRGIAQGRFERLRPHIQAP